MMFALGFERLKVMYVPTLGILLGYHSSPPPPLPPPWGGVPVPLRPSFLGPQTAPLSVPVITDLRITPTPHNSEAQELMIAS